jgi:hypothetical protein
MDDYVIVVGEVSRNEYQDVRMELFRRQGHHFKTKIERLMMDHFHHFAVLLEDANAERQALIREYEMMCQWDHMRMTDATRSQLVCREVVRDFNCYKKTGSSPKIKEHDVTMQRHFSSMVEGLDVFNIVAVVFESEYDKIELFTLCYSKPDAIESSQVPSYIFSYKL